MVSEKILTVPDEIQNYEPYYITGNQYVSLPMIQPNSGGIECINIISMTARSLIEFYGDESQPFLSPYIVIDGNELDFAEKLEWKYENYWIPAFSYKNKTFEYTGKLVAPFGLKGFVYIFNVRNTSLERKNIKLGIRGRWKTVKQTIYTDRLIKTRNYVYFDHWTDSLVMETIPGLSLAAVALSASQKLDKCIYRSGKKAVKESESEIVFGNRDSDFMEFIMEKQIMLAPDCNFELAFYVGVNSERDGVRTVVVDLKRNGFKNLYNATLNWLRQHSLKLQNPRLTEVMNKNLFFNYFFSVGNTIDTEECVMMTSRSPRYYVSAAYWPRDTFLWSFPGLLLIDRDRAKEVLEAGYARHVKNAGVHSHYINGSVLYPGFELDQLCSYIIALEQYLKTTGDNEILENSAIKKGIRHIFKELLNQKHENKTIFKTFLDPSDDPVTFPYLIYDNALVYRTLLFISKIDEELRIQAHRLAQELKQVVMEFGVVETDKGKMFAWSIDMKGNYKLYDNPPGSLMLLPYHGFCSVSDKIFINTLKWIYSEQNEFMVSSGKFRGLASAHAKHPWILSLCNQLLSTKPEQAGKFLEEAFMDNGFACETVDSKTGIAKTGCAFATCAGFLAYALYTAFGEKVSK